MIRGVGPARPRGVVSTHSPPTPCFACRWTPLLLHVMRMFGIPAFHNSQHERDVQTYERSSIDRSEARVEHNKTNNKMDACSASPTTSNTPIGGYARMRQLTATATRPRRREGNQKCGAPGATRQPRDAAGEHRTERSQLNIVAMYRSAAHTARMIRTSDHRGCGANGSSERTRGRCRIALDKRTPRSRGYLART